MKPREIFFGGLLFTVVATTTWRMLTPRNVTNVAVTVTDERPAPVFQLLDQNGRPAQLQGYLNRHRILLVFFDGRKGINGDPLMEQIRKFAPAIKRTGVKLIAVSTPLTPEIKLQAETYPFPVLRDNWSGQPGSSSVKWGTAVLPTKEATAPIRPAMFVIEHTGMVEWEGDKPKAVADPALFLTQLIAGS